MPDQRNLILAIVLSVTIILAFQYFYELPRIKRCAAPAGPATGRAAHGARAEQPEPARATAPARCPAAVTPARRRAGPRPDAVREPGRRRRVPIRGRAPARLDRADRRPASTT